MGRPFRLIFSCSTSRVVPAISVTIARSLPANAFKSEDLPAFGFPAMTTCKPSRSNWPWRADCCTSVTELATSSSSLRIFPSARKSISSSGKSIAASTCKRKWISFSNTEFTLTEKAPCKERTAERAAACDVASIRSAMASACTRSSLPFSKARMENSPALAAMAPSSNSRESRAFWITGPPWPCSSTTSSPVNE